MNKCITRCAIHHRMSLQYGYLVIATKAQSLLYLTVEWSLWRRWWWRRDEDALPLSWYAGFVVLTTPSMSVYSFKYSIFTKLVIVSTTIYVSIHDPHSSKTCL